MQLQNYQYDEIMREYSRRQADGRRTASRHFAVAAERIPGLLQNEKKIARLGAGHIHAMLESRPEGGISLQSLKNEISRLTEERRSLLISHGFPEDYLDIPYTCPRCQDTGYVGSEKCTCLRKAEASFLYSQSNLGDILDKENFSAFSFDYYSDSIINASTGLNARQTAQIAFEAANSFVRTFDDSFQNLFLYGDTGVGKTFLSHCIAGELLQRAHSVLYFSAQELFEKLAGFAFSRDAATGCLDDILQCDLLIIDDLGTELTNSFVSSQLFLCVNERLLRRKSTLISTNLTLEDFSDTYSERTFSRIAGSYRMLKLIGKDIRIQKRCSS